MKKIKVLRIIARLNIGGPALHAIFLNEGLTKAGFETRLIAGTTSKDEGDIAYLVREKGLSLTIVPELGRNIRLGSDFIALWKIFRIIQREKPYIVHTHTAKAGTLGRFAAMMDRVPIKVHSFHGHVFHNYFNPITTRIFIFIEKIFAKFTDRLIVVSDIIKEDICNHFKIADNKKVSVIRLGVDLEKFKDLDRIKGTFREELHINKEVLLIGIVGRLTAIKNHKLFLEAVKLLKDQISFLKVKFLVIGDGELRQFLENHVSSLGIKEWISFIGWRKDMPHVYADLDIVILTSLNEGTPLSLIEAMAAKKAVVATKVGGVPDLVEHKKTGLLVDTNNPVALKEAISLLLKDEDLRIKLGQAASAYVYANYSKERLIKDMENLYTELIRIKRDKKGLKGKYRE